MGYEKRSDNSRSDASSKNGNELPIRAPYNFVPLSGWVYEPDWAQQANHDIPFRDGICGTFSVEITTHTPLMVGGEQRRGTTKEMGSVAFSNIDGQPIIPGTALRGMLRNVLEIATFGKMQNVDDRRYSIRDLTGGTANAYGGKMTSTLGHKTYRANSRAGWLRFDAHLGGWVIARCDYARVEHSYLGKYAAQPNFARDRQSAQDKYQAWKKPLETNFDCTAMEAHDHSRAKLVYKKVTKLGSGPHQGILVFTGQPSQTKHMEFVFFDKKIDADIVVPEKIMRGFLDIHEETAEWKYWRDQAEIPIFYLPENETVQSFGLALMYKLPYTYTVGETIDHTSSDHRDPSLIDFCETMFGFSSDGDKKNVGLRSRVSIGCATLRTRPGRNEPTIKAILNGPKPTYFPSYLKQQHTDGTLKNGTYSTYMDKTAEIRGWKRYPVKNELTKTTIASDQNKVAVEMSPLAAGVTFRVDIRVHNLRKVELGALVWALTWGNNSNLRHGLGMGRALGLGQISIALVTDSWRGIKCNDPTQPAPAAEHCAQEFEAHMEAQCKKQHKIRWRNSPQIMQLIGMANPENAIGRDLSHMNLAQKEFVERKKAGEVLTDYISGAQVVVPVDPNNQAADQWLTNQIELIMTKNKSKEDDVLRGLALAQAWQALEPGHDKKRIRDSIQEKWEDKDWWVKPPSPKAKQAKEIYLSSAT